MRYRMNGDAEVDLSASAKNFPSGDQDKREPQSGKSSTADSPNFRSAPPSAGIIQISDRSPRSRQNAIYRPSGDQAGAFSSAGLLVSLSGFPASTSLTYISKFSPFSPFQANATCLPSGEKAGVICRPG